MYPLLRHRPMLHSIVLACALVLLAAQTLASIHVHADDTACVVCGLADNPLAAKGPSATFPASDAGRTVNRACVPERPDRPLFRTFDPRGPPASAD